MSNNMDLLATVVPTSDEPENENIERNAQIAAKWWADKLRYIKPSHYSNGTQSDKAYSDMMNAFNRNINQKHLCPDEANINRFEKLLAMYIAKKLSISDLVILCVNEVPDWILLGIARRARVNISFFPWKTSMIISKKHVTVSTAASPNNDVLI